MASERVSRAVAHLGTGSRDIGPLRELNLTADEYDDLLAAVRWDYGTARGMKNAVQNLAQDRRLREQDPLSWAIRYLGQGNRDLEPIRALNLTAAQLNDVIARTAWGYDHQALREAVQNLYDERRAEEAAARGQGASRPGGGGPRYGKWEIDRELSPGGQAHTFLVRDRTSPGGPLHVLKVLKNPKRLGRFTDEVRAAERLDHPNIVRVVGSDLAAERPYLVTEYCEGGALDEADIAGLSLLERLGLLVTVARAVAFAHDQGVIHRDLKPANIFLRGDRRTPVVGDFGLCFLNEEGERFTAVDEVVGPRWYTAPELEDGRSDDVGTWSDVYSLAKVLYWLVAGKKIFNRERHREGRYDLTRDADSPGLFFIYDVLDAALLADHQRRTRTARQLAQAVEGTMARIESGAHVLDLNVPQPCDFCGVGRYRQYASTAMGGATIRNFGLNPAGTSDVLILACNECGHLQMFRVDAGREGAWKR
jgi:hypothetical protein